MKRLSEVDAMTMREFRLLSKAWELRNADQEYRLHKLAYLNRHVQAKKKVGKRKQEYVFKTFEEFFNYKSVIENITSRSTGHKDSRFRGLIDHIRSREQ